MSYNAGLLYYKHYYKGIQFDGGDGAMKIRYAAENKRQFEARNKQLVDLDFSNAALQAFGTETGVLSFNLTTTYPGLILGTGYTHGSGLEGEFKTGFYFDHTTGLPVIPGSSVKGLLRSAFPGLYYEKALAFKKQKGKDEEVTHWQSLGDMRKRFIINILKAIKAYDGDAKDDFVERLEREIFEGLHGVDREKSEHHFSMSNHDVFFDAVIVRSEDGKIFEKDFITPHKNSLKNPVPIQILKVRPGVQFAFQFLLREKYVVDENPSRLRLLTPAQRLELFRRIILQLGAGAKTNTGYGAFDDDQIHAGLTTDSPVGSVSSEGKENASVSAPLAVPKSVRVDRVKRGDFVYGEVIRREDKTLYFKLYVEGYTKEVSCQYAAADKFQAGQQVRLRVNNVEGKDEKLRILVGEPLKI